MTENALIERLARANATVERRRKAVAVAGQLVTDAMNGMGDLVGCQWELSRWTAKFYKAAQERDSLACMLRNFRGESF